MTVRLDSRTPDRRWSGRLLLVFAAVALIAGACSTDSDDSGEADAISGAMPETPAAFDSVGDEAAEPEAAMDDGDAEFGEGADLASPDAQTVAANRTFAPGEFVTPPSDPEAVPEPGQQGPEIATQAEDFGRDIIRTATVTAEVDDVLAAGRQATDVVRSVGGYVAGQSTVTTGNQDRTTLTFKVPPKDFDATLASVGGVGKVLEQTISASDVTERIVNLGSQITTAEASVERLRGFLANASDLTEVARFEAQLLERETQLELLRGQLRTLQNQVGLSTITLTLLEKVPPAPDVAMELVVTAYVGHDAGATCPGTESPQIVEDDPVTLCYELTNTGDSALAEFAFRDEAHGTRLRDLTLLSGDVDAPLEPGSTLTWIYETDAEGSVFLSRAQMNAFVVLDPNDDSVSTTANAELGVTIEPIVDRAGFGDGFGQGWDALTEIVRVLAVVLGFLLPFVWLLPVAWIVSREWGRRRRANLEAERAAREARFASGPPSPEPAEAEPVGASSDS